MLVSDIDLRRYIGDYLVQTDMIREKKLKAQ